MDADVEGAGVGVIRGTGVDVGIGAGMGTGAGAGCAEGTGPLEVPELVSGAAVSVRGLGSPLSWD